MKKRMFSANEGRPAARNFKPKSKASAAHSGAEEAQGEVQGEVRSADGEVNCKQGGACHAESTGRASATQSSPNVGAQGVWLRANYRMVLERAHPQWRSSFARECGLPSLWNNDRRGWIAPGPDQLSPLADAVRGIDDDPDAVTVTEPGLDSEIERSDEDFGGFGGREGERVPAICKALKVGWRFFAA